MRIISDKYIVVANDATYGFYRIWKPDGKIAYNYGNNIAAESSAKRWPVILICFEFVVAVGAAYRRGVLPDLMVMGENLEQSVIVPIKPTLYGFKTAWTGRISAPYGLGYLMYPGSLETNDVVTVTICLEDKSDV